MNVLATLQEESEVFRQVGKRVLESVENLFKQPGAQLDGQQLSSVFDFRAGGYGGCVLEHLHVCKAASDSHDFRHE